MSKKREEKKEESFNYEEFERDAISRLRDGDNLVGKEGIFTSLIQRIVNSALEGEMIAHLNDSKSKGISNRRNGHTSKRVKSSMGPFEVSPPRDRNGSFEPEIVGKWDRQLGSGVEEQILSFYASGNSIEDIRKQLALIYGLDYSHGTISAVTDGVWKEVLDWQERVLESCYVVIFLDAIHFKVRKDGVVKTQAIYTVYGINPDGERDVLGLYLGENEGAKHWGLILEDLAKRGVESVLFFCIDGLKGFKESIAEVFPNSLIQRCIVHMVRNSVRFVSDKDKRVICKDLKRIYTAADRTQAEIALEVFQQTWDHKYPEVAKAWKRDWEELMAFMDYGQHIRRMIYTTNAVEALHRIMRKTTKTKGAWVNEKGLLKQLYLSLKFNESSWKRSVAYWRNIQRELALKFGEQYTQWL